MTKDLVPVNARVGVARELQGLPVLIAEASPQAVFAWEEFFSGEVRNAHTRRAYERAVRSFLAWCQDRGLSLTTITPGDVGRYLDGLDLAAPSKKVHLAALRKFFDRLTVRHAVVLNPAASVRAERYTVVEGKTAEIGIKDARKLLASIDVGNVVGLRDRALLGVLIYTAARVGAVARLRLQDLHDDPGAMSIRFAEKGGKSRQIPVRHDLAGFLKDYLAAAKLQGASGDEPLFRTVKRLRRDLSSKGVTDNDIRRMLKRRLKKAGLSARFSPHSFRVTVVTDLLEQGQPLEDVQHLAGHSDPRTTRLYDRRKRKITRNLVERISV